MRRISSIFGRALMGAAALMGVGQPGSAIAAPGWTASGDDALLFDVRLSQYRLGDGVRGYQTPGGTCVDLADTIMALDISLRLDKKLRRATGWAFEEGHKIAIDREADTVQIMNKVQKLGSGDIYDTPEGWCVDTKRLSSWLGIELNADQSNALLVIKSSAKLPVELQMERRSRAAKVQNVASFDLATLPHAHTPFKGIKAPSVDAVVSIGGLKQGGGGHEQFNVRYELYAAGEVGPIAYNARLSSNNQGVPSSLRLQAYRTDPEANLLGPLHATHVAAGDVSGVSTPLVSQATSGRGIIVTNRPIDRPASFDRTDFRGELPTGWDAELYRNGQLLAFAVDRADGRYEFLDVPLQYGQNRFEVVLYGPQGQIRRESRAVPVGLDSIPPRKTYYWAGLYQEGYDLITLDKSIIRPGLGGWRGGVGVERGLNVKTSAALYGHSLVLDDGLRRFYGEASIRRAVGPTLIELGGSMESRGGYALRGQILGELAKTSFSLESIIAKNGYQSDRIGKGVTGIHQLGIDHSINLGRAVVPIHLDARYTTRDSGETSLESRARISTTMGRMSFTGELGVRQDHLPFGPSPPAVMEAAFLANAYVGRVRVRGESRFRLAPDARFESASLIAEWSAGKDDRYRNDWRAELGYDAQAERARASIGYVRRFKKFSLTGSVEAASDGSVAAGLSLAFSLGPKPGGHGIRVTSRRLATSGQAIVRVFRDLNGDGRYQPGEPLEKDVQLAAGRNPVEDLTGKDGTVMLDSLEPYIPVLIGVDASSLPDPLVQPATTGLVVTPRPGVAAIIDLALVSAGEVDGTLIREGGGTIEGVDLELVDVEGQVRGKTRSEYDGFFLFEGVPYGRYSVRIAKISADAARLKTALVGQLIVAGETPSIHLGTRTAEAAAQQAAK
jgi:hypothetical protein